MGAGHGSLARVAIGHSAGAETMVASGQICFFKKNHITADCSTDSGSHSPLLLTTHYRFQNAVVIGFWNQ